MSCGTQVSPGFLKTVSPTGLSPSAAALPFAFGYRLNLSLSAILQPRAARRHAPGLGSSAFARHYSRNHCYFLFLRVLRCFSSPRSLHTTRCGDGIATAGFPHSDIRGSRSICLSPRLFAAYHVLLRLREPQASPMRPSSFSFYFRLCARRSLRFDLRSLLLLLTQSVARLFHLRFHHVNVLCVENNGFEPLTPCLQSRCSSQLS